jgi:hypothetical protein
VVDPLCERPDRDLPVGGEVRIRQFGDERLGPVVEGVAQ